MSNAAKLKKRAAELEQKKHYDKALALYIQVLDESDASQEEADVSLYNRVGDLLFRVGNVSEALTYYEKAADLYAERGFLNNAIALCNKVLRQSPGRTSVYYKLGKISATKGFKSDAKKNFLEYADRMRSAGNPDEAFRALKEFADLCPDQDDIRLMLADQLSRENRRDEALEQLQTLHSKLQTEGRNIEARATVERMQALDPSIAPRRSTEMPAVGEGDLVFLDVSYDEPVGSIGRAPIVPIDIEAPSGLELTTFDGGADDAAAPDEGLRLITGFTPPESRIAVEYDPPPIDGIETLGSIDDADDEGDADAAEARRLGLADVIGAPITGAVTPVDVVEIDDVDGSDQSDDRSRAPDAGSGDAFDAMMIVSSDEFRLGDRFEAPAYDLDAARGGMDGLTGALPLGAEDDIEPPVVDAGPAGEAPTVPSFDLGLGRDPAIDHAIADLVEERASHTDLSDLPMLDVGAEPRDDASVLEATLALHESASPDVPAPFQPSAPRREHDAALDLLGARLDAAPDDWMARRRFAEALLDAGERDRGLAQLEGAMLGLEQEGRFDDAVTIADELVRLVPTSVAHHQKRVEYAVRANDRARLISAYVDLADSLLRAGEPEKSHAVYRRATELAPDDARARAGLRLFEPAMRATPLARPAIGRETPWRASRAIPSTPTSAPVPAAPAPPSEPPRAAGEEFVDLGQWLRGQQQPRSTRMYTAAPQPTGDEDADFAEMLRRFKQGVAANVDEEDSDSHYDLGVAYREMGLVDEAIAEFQKALHGSAGRLRACEALGQCFLDKGQFAVAATVLTRAVESAPGDDHQLVGVLYLSGYAAEALERWRDAQMFYQRVFAVDIQFRDVAERLTAMDRLAK